MRIIITVNLLYLATSPFRASSQPSKTVVAPVTTPASAGLPELEFREPPEQPVTVEQATEITSETTKPLDPENMDPFDEAWENYENVEEQIAEEVTKGVRVEDIVEPVNDYQFAAFGRRDPFIPPKFEEIKLVPDIPIVSALQKFASNELKLVGIWQLETAEKKALIMTPEDEGVIVREGDPAGNKGGRILTIDKAGLVIREFNIAPDGTRQFEDINLPLKEAEEKIEENLSTEDPLKVIEKLTPEEIAPLLAPKKPEKNAPEKGVITEEIKNEIDD